MEMRWHKFLTNFGLWAGAVLNLSSAGRYFAATEVAGIFGVCGALLVALAVYCIVVRFALARFKAGAPKKLVILNICAGASGIVLTAIISAGTGLPMSALFDSSSIGSTVAGFAMAVYNSKYYAQRADMFVD